MAKTQYSIQITFKKAVAKADELETVAKAVEKQKERLEECQRSLAEKWKGTNAAAYCSKLGARVQELAGIARDLRATSAAINDIAETTYKADKRAVELAKARGRK